MPVSWHDGLLDRLRSGDEQVVGAFLERFQPRCIAIARRRGVPAHDCPAVAQDALTDAFERIKAAGLRDPAKLPGFIRAVLMNKVSDYWRRRGPSMVPLEELPERTHDTHLSAPSSEEVLMVQEVLARLNADDQIVLWLYDVEEYTLEEVGHMLGLRKSASGERVKAARERFRVEAGNSSPLSRLRK
jgi:RNA polymerase sigma factor (sigma-70 family)